MNLSRNKYFVFLIFFLIPLGIAYGQNLDLAGPINRFYDNTIVPFFPWAVLIIFLFVAAGNFSNFFGQNADIQKGLKNTFLYPFLVMIIGVIVNWIKNFQL